MEQYELVYGMSTGWKAQAPLYDIPIVQNAFVLVFLRNHVRCRTRLVDIFIVVVDFVVTRPVPSPGAPPGASAQQHHPDEGEIL